MKILAAFLALLAVSSPAFAKDVSLKSDVFVERIQKDAQGNSKTVLEEPKLVTPGDKLVFVLSYKNQGNAPATEFLVNNPIPQAVAYAGTESSDALVSVDGGKVWGQLAALKVTDADGKVRPAQAADVTHIKWQFAKPIPAGSEGKLSFRGIVK